MWQSEVKDETTGARPRAGDMSGAMHPPRVTMVVASLETKNPGGGDEGHQWHVTDNHSKTGQ